MWCPKCKEELIDGTRICPFCGADIAAVLAARTTKSQTQKPTVNTKNGARCALAGFILSIISIPLCFTLILQIAALILSYIGFKHTAPGNRMHELAKTGKKIALAVLAFFILDVIVIVGSYYFWKGAFAVWG